MASPLQAAIDHIIMAATELDIVCSLAKEGTEIASYESAAYVCRELAMGLLPDTTSWPEGGAEIYCFETRRKVSK